MKPPRGIKVGKPYRHGDMLLMDITMAKWRVWYEMARVLIHARIKVNVSIEF